MLFVRDDIGHDDVMGFDGHVGDDLDIPGRSNRGCSALSGQEAVIIGRPMAQSVALGVKSQAGHENDIELIGFDARIVRRCRPDAVGAADSLFQRIQAPPFDMLFIDADRDVDFLAGSQGVLDQGIEADFVGHMEKSHDTAGLPILRQGGQTGADSGTGRCLFFRRQPVEAGIHGFAQFFLLAIFGFGFLRFTNGFALGFSRSFCFSFSGFFGSFFSLFRFFGCFLAFGLAQDLGYSSAGDFDFDAVSNADDEVIVVQGNDIPMTPPTVTILAPGFKLSSISCRFSAVSSADAIRESRK